MKINWGTGIVLAFIAFISFILYFVFTALSDPKADHELVTDRYYSKDLEYQQDLYASANLEAFNGQIKLEKVTEGLAINFPESMGSEIITGTVNLYRPSNENLDFELPLRTTGNRFVVPADHLVEGRWNISIKWEISGKPYLFRSKLTY
ncbi:MAG: hypothetical protein RLZZ241_1774 [Bacteroidota bacterium]|jgi:nitrogen fixation protein FixH